MKEKKRDYLQVIFSPIDFFYFKVQLTSSLDFAFNSPCSLTKMYLKSLEFTYSLKIGNVDTKERP